MVTTRAGAKTVVANGATGSRNPWIHAPSRVLLLWFAVSLPLVCWDTIYVLGRPLTMEGGAWHWPFYVPYKLYGEVDHVYGWKAFDAKLGFTGAQGFLNAIETAMYLYYIYVYWTQGVPAAAVAGGTAKVIAGRDASKTIVLVGKPAATAVLVAFSAFVMTLSKTVLYCTCPPFSDRAMNQLLVKNRTSAKCCADLFDFSQGCASTLAAMTTSATMPCASSFSCGSSPSKYALNSS